MYDEYMKNDTHEVTPVAPGGLSGAATHLLSERIMRALGGGEGALRVVPWPLTRRDVGQLAREVFPDLRAAVYAAEEAWRGLGRADEARRAAGLTTFYRDVPPMQEGAVTGDA